MLNALFHLEISFRVLHPTLYNNIYRMHRYIVMKTQILYHGRNNNNIAVIDH